MKAQVLKADYSNPEHKQSIKWLLNHYACDIMGGGKALSESVLNATIEGLSKKSYAFSFICYEDDKPVGLANCFESFSTFSAKPLINIHDLMVHEAYRGKGYSQLLLQAIEDYAIVHDYCKITLEVLEGNFVAKSSYSKFGFKAYELDPRMGKAEFMEKKLEEAK